MSQPVLTQERMRAAVTALEQALYNHERWTDALYATLVCHLPADDRDVKPDAHLRCQFGQWYYTSGQALLDSYPGFAEIENEHRCMHQYAAKLLHLSANGDTVALSDYERFVSALKRARLEITTLKHELETTLFNLDPLTGVSGRVGMLTRLRELHDFVRRGVHVTCVAMIDVDLFKQVNDRYGHAAGDKVLVDVAQYLQSHVRSYDKLFRYGGEEFLLCMPQSDIVTAQAMCERLIANVAGLRHDIGGEVSIQVTVSVGIALLTADLSVEESVKRADAALFQAKKNGRNRVAVWEPAMIGEAGVSVV